LNDAAIRKAVEAIEEDRNSDAIEILEPIANEDNPDPDALVYLGIAYVQDERPKDAVNVLRHAEELIEAHCVVSLFLGRALRSLGKYGEAESQLRKAVDLDPEDPEAWVELGKLLYSKGDYREAARILDEGILLFPEDLSLRGTLALALYRLGDLTQAGIEWAHMYRLNPDIMAAITNYAYILLLENRIEEATPLVESAYAKEPLDYRSLILKGLLALSEDKRAEAKSYFEKVLESDPDNAEALSRLAVVLHEDGNVTDSHAYLVLAEKQMGSNQECWRGLCFAYSRLGLHDKYVDCLIRWTEVDPGAAAPWIELAIEYDRMEKRSSALHAWKKSVELRGYIRVHCKACGSSFRTELKSAASFNPYESQHCTSCGNAVAMPAGL
jgi:Flp pilus assembly protein TadD